MRLTKIVAAFALLLALGSCSKFGKVLKSKDYNYKLAMADKYFDTKKYKYAQQLYEELFPLFKGTQQFEELYYKYAYCFYYGRDYHEAENLFKGFLEVFPNSPKSEEVDYMRAYCFYKQSPRVELDQTNTNKAMGMMQTFINTHPGSPRIKEATAIIDEGRAKLEKKEYHSAQLYFDLGSYRAAAISFANLLNNYPESAKGDIYKLMVIKSYYKYAQMSILEKQIERFEKVIEEYEDFVDRFSDSKLLKDAESYNNLSINKIKAIKNEQASSSAKR